MFHVRFCLVAVTVFFIFCFLLLLFFNDGEDVESIRDDDCDDDDVTDINDNGHCSVKEYSYRYHHYYRYDFDYDIEGDKNNRDDATITLYCDGDNVIRKIWLAYEHIMIAIITAMMSVIVHCYLLIIAAADTYL